MDRWYPGLQMEDDGHAIGAAGYMASAFDAWTDAAQLAYRHSRPSKALERAMAIAQDTGVHPVLDELPHIGHVGPG